jgi:hypothetical protein
MERLTIRSNNGDMVWYKDVENNDAYVEPCEMTPHHSRMAIAKLADYEDAEEHGFLLNVNAAVANIEKQRDAWNDKEVADKRLVEEKRKAYNMAIEILKATARIYNP